MADRLRILVVDNEPGMRLGIERALRNFTVQLLDVDGEVFFGIESVECGEVALKKIEAAPPDILLLDHKLPGISGLDVLHELAEARSEVLTIMITAYASLDTAITATKRGAFDTRIESGNRKRDLQELDVSEVAKSCIETVMPDANAKKITVAFQAPGSVRMIADRGELEIILNNLVSNAVKYNREGGRVTVTLTARNDQVRIAVADTGIGLTREEAGQLFREFVRIKNEHTCNILGSGLGLSIVKKIAALYGGDVAVESQADIGSTFTVLLNRASAAGDQEGDKPRRDA